ncbi:uncharacterized protein LOC111618090 [Centruroides sculpturatus]|uniref:uncharacterized protein LOC111618090 n=1 Tax=Centruroides sculpturatus TaxID=218467 RepID=UPI000C6DAC42|nr:uncharacterized protein LOC111618090 [Centruroides sculpturatus]
MDSGVDRIGAMNKFLEELNEFKTSPTGEDYTHWRIGLIGNYSLKPEEIQAETLDWALQFLEQRKCPSNLALAMAKHVSQKMNEFAHQDKMQCNGMAQTDGGTLSLEAVYLHTQTIHQLYDLAEQLQKNPDQMLTMTSVIKSPQYVTSICTIKNGRRKMEDRYTIIHDLNTVCGLQNTPQFSYYGVFDGHAGIRAANYAASHLHENIVNHPDFTTDITKAIKEGFQITDNQIVERSKGENTKSGCTVVCSFIQENALYVAWVGDSQAILVREGDPYIITNPHKPDRKDERERIEELNGCVMYIGTWRVNGTLAVSRALGDPEHKPYVSAEPDVVKIPLQGNEDFFVLACDGLWDRLNPSDVASAIYSYIVEHPFDDYEDVASRLVQQAKEHGSSDNITAIVIFLKDPKELASNPKNPPSHSFLLDGTKVDSWYQGSWNGSSENDNIGYNPFSETAIKPNSLEGLSKISKSPETSELTNFYFHPLESEGGEDFETNGFKDTCQSGLKSVMPETTAFSELPTPPIDELLASEQFQMQNDNLDSAKISFTSYETHENKSTASVTLADSGILDQENPQSKPSDSNFQDIQLINFDSKEDMKIEEVNSDTAIEMASEIVNNAIELAVNQVLIRTTSQSPQHPDDSGLEEGPLEESDVSVESNSPEFDIKNTKEIESMSFDNVNLASAQDNKNINYEYQTFKHFETLSENPVLEKTELAVGNADSKESCNIKNSNDTEEKLIDFTQSFNENKPSNVTETNLLLSTNNGALLEPIHVENIALGANSTTIISEPKKDDFINHTNSSKEMISANNLEKSDLLTENIEGKNSKNPAFETKPNDLVSIGDCLPVENVQYNIPAQSSLPTEVGQLLEQLADKEEKTLSDSLSVDQSATTIDLVVIPDGVPEAEGVTEDVDSDSEKDGGWSYIQGGKPDLSSKNSTPRVAQGKTAVKSKKLPLVSPITRPSKLIKKEPAKSTVDVKPTPKNNVLKKKVLPEKTVKDKLDKSSVSSVTKSNIQKVSTTPNIQKVSTAPKTSKVTLDQKKSVQSKEPVQSRPKSAPLISTIRVSGTKTNITSVQKTSATTRTISRPQKISTTTESISSTTNSSNITTHPVKKLDQKPSLTVSQRSSLKTVSTTSHSTSNTQSKSLPQTSRILPSKSSIKHSDVKQTKDSANKNISSKPSAVAPKELATQRRPVPIKKSSSIQNSLSQTSRNVQRSVPSTQKTMSRSMPSTQKPVPTSKSGSKTGLTSEVGTNLKSKQIGNRSKSTDKPKECHQPDQEKGTLEQLTKEVLAGPTASDKDSEIVCSTQESEPVQK